MALTPAQLLDELMGPNRNALPNEAKSELHWSDDNVCKRFLCGFCPSQLFTNTRSDLGPCEKIHDENLRQLYKKSKRFGRMQYEDDFLRYLQSIMADVERRIRRGHQRLSLNAKTKENKDISQEDEEKVLEISREINSLIPQVEELGSEGRVDEAQALTEQIDKLKEQRERIQAQARTDKSWIKDPMSNQDKQMEVCETCGAFLIVGDAQSRVDDHLMGKQHMGYAKIKLTIEELLVKKDSENDSRRNRDGRDGDNQKNRDRDRSKDRERSRDRDKNRDRDRDRSPDRDKNRDRRDRRDRYDRDYDRHRSSRHDDSDRRRRDRDEYSRHRPRSRSRERHGRSRHDERDRRRSRSPHRRRSRSSSPRSK